MPIQTKIKPTQDTEKLKQNIETRLKTQTKVEKEEMHLEIPKKQIKTLSRIPGVEKYQTEEQENWEPGLKGKPVQKQAYAKIKDKKDLVKALIATQEGYNLILLNTPTEFKWDIRFLKKYNPSIKEIKEDQPIEQLKIEKTITPLPGKKLVEIEMPSDQEIEKIYQEMLT